MDPAFVDSEAGDFRLRTGSPAVDAGDPADPCDGEPVSPDGCVMDLGHLGNTPYARAPEPL